MYLHPCEKAKLQPGETGHRMTDMYNYAWLKFSLPKVHRNELNYLLLLQEFQGLLSHTPGRNIVKCPDWLFKYKHADLSPYIGVYYCSNVLDIFISFPLALLLLEPKMIVTFATGIEQGQPAHPCSLTELYTVG